MNYILILCMAANNEMAKEISFALVHEKLAACVNSIPNIASVYTWDDAVVEDNETLLLIKTKKELFEEVKNRILELHTYKVPEIICLNIEDGLKAYLDWIKKETK